jgi:hypothetical protein
MCLLNQAGRSSGWQEACFVKCAACVVCMAAGCSAVAATPDMKTLIAAGNDKKIKEMEDNSVSHNCRTFGSPQHAEQQVMVSAHMSAPFTASSLRTDAWQPPVGRAPACVEAAQEYAVAAHAAIVLA